MKFTSSLLLAALASSASAQLFGAPAGQPPSRTESLSSPRGSGGFGRPARPNKSGGPPRPTGSAPFPLETGTFGAQEYRQGSARPSGKDAVDAPYPEFPSHDASGLVFPTAAGRKHAHHSGAGYPRETGGFGARKAFGTGLGRPEPTGGFAAPGHHSRKGGFARPSGTRSRPSFTGSDFALPTYEPKTGSPSPIEARALGDGDKPTRPSGGARPSGAGGPPSREKPHGFRPSGVAYASANTYHGGAAPSAGFPTTFKTRARPAATP
ncbi:unnamed protein product [Diplocarpon coronariae]|nr:hypothetical protein JHW43_009452 [Diplocarpon mali]